MANKGKRKSTYKKGSTKGRRGRGRGAGRARTSIRRAERQKEDPPSQHAGRLRGSRGREAIRRFSVEFALFSHREEGVSLLRREKEFLSPCNQVVFHRQIFNVMLQILSTNFVSIELIGSATCRRIKFRTFLSRNVCTILLGGL